MYTVEYNSGRYRDFACFADALEFAGANRPARVFGATAEESEDYSSDGLTEEERELWEMGQ